MNASEEQTRSLWMLQERPGFNAPRLAEGLNCDVVVVGAGIAGLSVAYELSQVGKKVVVLDRGRIAGGVTSRTTAHLAPVCDDGVAEPAQRAAAVCREVVDLYFAALVDADLGKAPVAHGTNVFLRFAGCALNLTSDQRREIRARPERTHAGGVGRRQLAAQIEELALQPVDDVRDLLLPRRGARNQR